MKETTGLLGESADDAGSRQPKKDRLSKARRRGFHAKERIGGLSGGKGNLFSAGKDITRGRYQKREITEISRRQAG